MTLVPPYAASLPDWMRQVSSAFGKITNGLSSEATLHQYNLDFFNPGDKFQNAANLIRGTDTATGTGNMYPALAIDNIVSASRANGPAQASIALTLRSIKDNFLSSTSTQETDGLYVQTKTGIHGDTSIFLGDALAVNGTGSTAFANLIEGTAGCTDGSGTVISRVRFQAANQDQASVPGSIDGVGCNIIAEIGAQNSALDITNSLGASWIYALRVIKDTTPAFEVLGNGYVGINAAGNSSIPLLVAADASNDFAIRLLSTDTGPSDGPTLSLFRDHASPANNDSVGYIPFDGRNSGAAEVTYGALRVISVNVTAGSEQGGLYGLVNHNGSLVQSFAAFYNTFYTSGPVVIPEVAAASAPTPATGSQALFLDTADHKLKRKDSSGTVTVIA